MTKDMKFLISVFSVILIIMGTTVGLSFHTQFDPDNLEYHYEIQEQQEVPDNFHELDPDDRRDPSDGPENKKEFEDDFEGDHGDMKL